MTNNLVLSLLIAVGPAAFAADGEAPANCSPRRPVCLQYALSQTEYAYMLATHQLTGPDFLKDFRAYSASPRKQEMVLAWRARIKKDAAARLDPKDPGRARLASTFFSARLTVARAKGMMSTDALRKLRADPARAREARDLTIRMKAVIDHSESLALDDLTFLAVAADVSQQADELGRFIAECLVPAGGVAGAAGSAIPACRLALGGR